MKGFYDTQIRPASNRLAELLGDERVNDPQTYTDHEYTTHIFVKDINSLTEYRLQDGEWIEQPPFYGGHMDFTDEWLERMVDIELQPWEYLDE